MESFSIPRAAVGLVLALVIGCVLWLLSAGLAGGGDGSFLPMKLFCPYNSIVRQIGGSGGDGTALDPMAFMVYGALICGGWPTIHRRRIMATCSVIHLLAAGIAMLVSGDLW